jgi:uncharacterized protein YciI
MKITSIKTVKGIGIFLMILFIIASIPAQSQEKSKYDAQLAAKYGGNDNGMKGYIFVILRTGPNKTTDKDSLNAYFAGHMANIQKLAAEGKMIVAGPFGKNENQFRGLFILNTTSNEEARKMLDGDPAVKDGIFTADLYTWWGSAALPAYMEVHEKITKK